LMGGEGEDDATKDPERADGLSVPEQRRGEHRTQAGRALNRHRVFELSPGHLEVSDVHRASIVHGAPRHGATTYEEASADRDGTSQPSMLGHVAKEPTVDEIQVTVARIAQPR